MSDTNLDRPVISIVHRKKPRETTYLRAVPKTAANPTVPQIRARLRFAEMAKKAKGKQFKKGGQFVGEMPPAAEAVRGMKGSYFGRTRKPKKWEKIVDRYAKRAHPRKFAETKPTDWREILKR